MTLAEGVARDRAEDDATSARQVRRDKVLEVPVAGPPVEPLARALGLFAQLLASVRADQWTLPTPCEAWTVRELVAHVVAGQQLLVGLLRDEPVPASDDDLLTAYRRSADDLLAAFAEPGALERIVTVPAGTMPAAVALHLRTTEALVHGWDLARATGLPFDVPADLAEAELAFSRPMLDRVPPEKRRFAPSQPVAEDAPALDRLLALLGRTPTTQEAR